MALLLHLDTSDKVCSVALSTDKQMIAEKQSSAEKEHASLVTVFINELLNENSLSSDMIQGVSVCKGPGSYTGLRIGVSVAKGICYGLGIPLIGINTLMAMSVGLKQSNLIENSPSTWYCPMIDARRMEVYYACYDHLLIERLETKASIIDSNSFSEILEERKLIFFGSGASKCKTTITHPNAIFIDDFFCKASFLIEPAYQDYLDKDFVDLAYFEPFYLKDFVSTAAK